MCELLLIGWKTQSALNVDLKWKQVTFIPELQNDPAIIFISIKNYC